MAITTLSLTPGTYSPVYGDLWFQLTSSSYANTNFKYVFDLQKVNLMGVGSALGRFKVPPAVGGYGLYNASRTMQTQLTYDMYPDLSSSYQAANSITGYRIKYGFEYDPGKNFAMTSATGSYLRLGFTASTGFLVGDIIQISKDDKTVNYEYDGTASVTGLGTYSSGSTTYYGVDTDKTYLAYYANESGAITSFLRIEGTSSTIYTFNGVRPYESKATNYGTVGEYLHTGDLTEGGSTYSMSNYPSGVGVSGWFPAYATSKTIELTDVETMSYLVDRSDPTIAPNCVGIQFYTNETTSGNYYTYSIPTSVLYKRIDVAAGPINIEAALGFNPFVINPDAKYYMVCLQSTQLPLGGRPPIPAAAINSYGLRFYKIKERDPIANCSPYPKIRLAFVNKLGGVDYFTFNFKSVNTMNTEKTFFKRELDFNYTVGDRQDFVLSQRATETYTISSDFMNDDVSNWLKELLQSTEVYLIQTNYPNTVKLPILITDTVYTVKTLLNNKSISVTLTYKTAYPINTAQG